MLVIDELLSVFIRIKCYLKWVCKTRPCLQSNNKEKIYKTKLKIIFRFTVVVYCKLDKLLPFYRQQQLLSFLFVLFIYTLISQIHKLQNIYEKSYLLNG